MKYPQIGNMITVVLEGAMAESGIVEKWGQEWIELRDPNTNSISCIKEKYIIGFKIIEAEQPKGIKVKQLEGVKAEQLESNSSSATTDVKSRALKMADSHINRIGSERKKVQTHLKKVNISKKYPDNYDLPTFVKVKK